jgi:hypothetical protein
MKRVLQLVLILSLCAEGFGQAKASQSPYPISGSGLLYFSPVALGVSALTEPAAGTSALSNIIDTTGARAVALKFSCTAGNVTVNVQTYQEDGATTDTLIVPLSAVPAATKTDFYIATEMDMSSSGGTLSGTAKIRFPQKAIAFSFTNAGAAGTCTARLFLSY